MSLARLPLPRRQSLRTLGPLLLALLTAACGKDAPVQEKPAAPAPAPAANPANGAVEKKAVAADQGLPEEPMALPAGQTLSDLLPAIPLKLPSVGGGEASAAPEHSCADSEPAGFELVKQLTLSLPAAKVGEAATPLSVCLFQQVLSERADKNAGSGRIYQMVATSSDGSSISGELPELRHVPKRLPPERQKAGHEGAGWAALVASGDPETPIMAVASGRFYDGALGEEVHFVRLAKVLRRQDAGWAWLPLVERSYAVTDFDHLHALCAGKADASEADRAAGALQIACDRAEELEGPREEARQARLATRKKRLAGGGGAAKVEEDADPQALWLRDARAAAAKGDRPKAVELALKAQAMCGEASAEAQAAVRQALASQQLEPVKVQPNQPTLELCEPLLDKAAPKRPRTEKLGKTPVKADKAAVKPAKPAAAGAK